MVTTTSVEPVALDHACTSHDASVQVTTVASPSTETKAASTTPLAAIAPRGLSVRLFRYGTPVSMTTLVTSSGPAPQDTAVPFERREATRYGAKRVLQCEHLKIRIAQQVQVRSAARDLHIVKRGLPHTDPAQDAQQALVVHLESHEVRPGSPLSECREHTPAWCRHIVQKSEIIVAAQLPLVRSQLPEDASLNLPLNRATLEPPVQLCTEQRDVANHVAR